MMLPAGAQFVDRATDPANSPLPIFLEPVYEGGVRKNRGIHIPVNLRAAPQRRLGVGYTASNSYLNPGLLVCADRSCDSDYETDHTGNLIFVTVTQPVTRALELGFTLGSYQMNNVPALALPQRAVSDGLLRSFHDHVIGGNTLPALSGAPDGRQVFSMTDLDGRRLTLVPEHAYALPLRIDLTRYFEIRRTPEARISLNAGLHVSYPFEGDLAPSGGRTAFSRGVDAGLSVNFVRSRRITANVASTYHVQLARFRSDVRVVNPNSPLPGDDDLRSQYALTFGLSFAGTFDGRAPCSFGVSQLSSSAHYDRARYWTWDPLVFAGGNNHRGAILGANDYGVLSFGCELGLRRYQISLVEDIGGFSQLLSDDGSGTSYDPDLAVGVTASWALGRR